MKLKTRENSLTYIISKRQRSTLISYHFSFQLSRSKDEFVSVFRQSREDYSIITRKRSLGCFVYEYNSVNFWSNFQFCFLWFYYFMLSYSMSKHSRVWCDGKTLDVAVENTARTLTFVVETVLKNKTNLSPNDPKNWICVHQVNKILVSSWLYFSSDI